MNNVPPIHVFATWKVKEGNIETVLQLLKKLSVESAKEKGNLFFKAHQSNTDATVIVLFEGYTDDAAIADHRNTVHYQDLVVGKIIPLLENRAVVLTTPLNQD